KNGITFITTPVFFILGGGGNFSEVFYFIPIKNDGRDWRHFEMLYWHFILVKWVCISLSIQKSSNSFQYLQNWKEFDTMIAHKIYHWDSKESNPSPLI
uniref:hypothetical protein n=1 Tax=Alloprevotella sp. TaxID=1872471 RepID=UPI003FEF0743